MALQRTVTLLPGVENRRAGRVLGDDGAERIVRTFHARFASIKCGGTTTARQAAEYVLREGKHAGDEDENKADVEASAGDKEAMLADARRIRQTARITHGPTGERILATQIIELPAESTKEQRQACAQAFVDDWRERGHQAIAVVHMHGHDKDRPQPHLHVLATGRPVAADGTVDRSAPLWRNRDEVKAERARTARLVNEHCHTVAAFHPGGFKDIGRAEDTPKWRTPTGVYLKVVAASAEGAGWEEKDAAGRAQYAAARKSAELAEPKRTRKKEIAAARERGEKPPRVRPTQRQRIARAEADRSELAADLDRLAAERARLEHRARDAENLLSGSWWLRKEAEKEIAALKEEKATVEADRNSWFRTVGEAQNSAKAAGKERDEQRERAVHAEGRVAEQWARADRAEASVATLTDEKQQAETRVGELEAQVRELTERQTKYVTDWHADREVEPPDLATVEGQSEAWANMRAWEIEEQKRRKDEAVAKKAEIEEIARERDEAVQQAAAAGASPELVERAEAERDALATGLGLTPEQVAQAARRAEGELAKAARQAREQAAAALQPHCMPIWRAHLVTSKRLADAVFDEGAEAAEALVRDPDRAGTVLANPDLSGVEELVAAIREADASRPRRTLTLQERAERAESAAAAEAERARAAELERDRAQEAGREARGKLSEMEAALRDVTRQRNDARAALESAGIEVQAAEEAARKQRIAKAQAEEAERGRRAEAEDAEWRRLDGLRSRWTRERQAREKYGYKREEMEGKRWSSDADMAHSYKHQFDQEARLIEVIDRKSYVLDDDARDRTEAVAVHDLLYEFAGRRGVDFGHGVVAPAWRIGCDVFLDHARTVAQDENGDRVHVAFPRVAGAPELVYDREQERWDYRHPEAQHSYWMKAEDAAGWEAAARIAHYASVRDALKRSDPVPDKVLADYPDLAPKPQQDKPKTPPTPEKEQQPAPENDPPSRGRGGGMEM